MDRDTLAVVLLSVGLIALLVAVLGYEGALTHFF
jgi:hypothetical protein